MEYAKLIEDQKVAILHENDHDAPIYRVSGGLIIIEKDETIGILETAWYLYNCNKFKIHMFTHPPDIDELTDDDIKYIINDIFQGMNIEIL